MNKIKTINQKELTGIIDYLSHKITHQDWKPDVIVTMAKGGLIPARLIARKLNIKKILSFGISFYDNDDKKVDVPIIYQRLDECKDLLKGKNILLVDDIADTGDSLKYCIEHLKELGIVGHDIGTTLYPDDEHLHLVSYKSHRNYRTCSLFYKPKSKIIPDFSFGEIDSDIWAYFPWE